MTAAPDVRKRLQPRLALLHGAVVGAAACLTMFVTAHFAENEVDGNPTLDGPEAGAGLVMILMIIGVPLTLTAGLLTARLLRLRHPARLSLLGFLVSLVTVCAFGRLVGGYEGRWLLLYAIAIGGYALVALGTSYAGKEPGAQTESDGPLAGH